MYLVGPVITASPEDKTVVIDAENITLTCVATGVPIPTIIWLHNGSAVDFTNDTDKTVTTIQHVPMEPGRVSSTITIFTIDINSTGYYACSAISDIEDYDPVISTPALVLLQGIYLMQHTCTAIISCLVCHNDGQLFGVLNLP